MRWSAFLGIQCQQPAITTKVAGVVIRNQGGKEDHIVADERIGDHPLTRDAQRDLEAIDRSPVRITVSAEFSRRTRGKRTCLQVGGHAAIHLVPQRVQRLRGDGCGFIRLLQILAGTKPDQHAITNAIGVLDDRGLAGNGHVAAASGLEQFTHTRAATTLPTGGGTQIEFPQVAAQVAGVDVIRDEITIYIDRSRRGQAVGRARTALVGSQLHITGTVQIHHKQYRLPTTLVTIGFGAVVSIANQGRPFAIAHQANLGCRVGIAKIRVRIGSIAATAIGKLQNHAGGGKRIRVRDVEHIQPLAAGTQCTHQEGAPATIDIHITHADGAIHKITMVVVRAGQLRQTAHHRLGDIGKGFLAIIRAESMHHAIIATHINHGRAIAIAVDEPAIIVKIIDKGRHTHIRRIRMDQITQTMIPLTEQCAFILADTPQILHALDFESIGIAGIRVDIEQVQLLGRQTGGAELTPSRCTIGVYLAQISEKPVALCIQQIARIPGRDGCDLAVSPNIVGQQLPGPAAGFEACLKYSAARTE